MAYKRLEKAIGLATRWHAGQERDGDCPLPYITHPIEVLSNLRYIGGVTDEDLLCAAALHDAVEETDATLKEIQELFGPRVRGLVKELTRYEPGGKETSGMSKEGIWQLRANLLVEEIAKMSSEAQTIKLADRLSNVREAKRTKAGHKLDRYLGQTDRILATVRREVNLALWDAIRAELPPSGVPID